MPTDVQQQNSYQKRNDEPAEAAEAPPVHLRRAQPAPQLLPRTAVWIASLPPRVQPHALTAAYARIANVLYSVWYDPPALEAYLDELLIGARPGRRGFPPMVLRDLHTLRVYYAGMHHRPMGSGRSGTPYFS